MSDRNWKEYNEALVRRGVRDTARYGVSRQLV
jgi:hypothetical protein